MNAVGKISCPIYKKHFDTTILSVVVFPFRKFVTNSCSINRNSIDPDQTAPKEQSDQGLHCLLRVFSLYI